MFQVVYEMRKKQLELAKKSRDTDLHFEKVGRQREIKKSQFANFKSQNINIYPKFCKSITYTV